MKKINWNNIGDFFVVLFAFVTSGASMYFVYKIFAGIYSLLNKLIDKI
jgi:hypothetical protein